MNPIPPELQALGRRHLAWGWGSLLVFLLLGIALEALHGFKASAYLDARLADRRLYWTLAHAHGTVLALVQIAFAVGLPSLADRPLPRLRRVGQGLAAGAWLIPAGFFLAGAFLRPGGPGWGVWLLPPGAAVLIASVGALAWGFPARSRPTSD